MVLTGHELTSHLRNVDRKKPDKLAVKDATHAARRVLQRPWRADSELHGILNKLITGTNSLSRIIARSNVLQATFAERIRKSDAEEIADSLQTVRNMSSAQYRFDSQLLPLIRFVHLFDACIAAAFSIAQVRRGGEDARHMQRFSRIYCRREWGTPIDSGGDVCGLWLHMQWVVAILRL